MSGIMRQKHLRYPLKEQLILLQLRKKFAINMYTVKTLFVKDSLRYRESDFSIHIPEQIW